MAIYAAGLFATSVGLASALLLHGETIPRLPAVVALGVLAAVAERGRVRLTRNIELSISVLPTIFAAVLFGPLAAMVVAAASMAGDFPRRAENRYPRAGLRWALYTMSESVVGGVTGLAAGAASGLAGGGFGGIVATTAVGAVTAQAADIAFGAMTISLRGNGRAADVIRAMAPVVAVSVPLHTPVVAVLAYAYQEISPWTLPLFLGPALAAQRLFLLYQEQRRLTDDLLIANARMERANLSFATALVATLDARDRYTAGHSGAVAIYARDIAIRMGLSEDEQQKAHLCGLVHDIGKIGLPPGLLEKPGALTLEERRQMEGHSVIGERILKNVEDYTEIAEIVRHHHERVDGHGYPDRLVGATIPLLSRIIAVADAYNAMTSDRPYRDAMPSRVARLRIAQAVETQFDTSVVAAFEAILAGAEETYRTGTRGDFTMEREETPLRLVEVA